MRKTRHSRWTFFFPRSGRNPLGGPLLLRHDFFATNQRVDLGVRAAVVD